MPRRFPRLRGDSRLYPFAARTALRRRQKHRAWALRLCGAAVLCLAAGLILRDTVFRGGQPEAPVTTAESTEQPSPTPIAITPRAATVDVLAAAESADSDVHSSPAPHPSPDAPRRRIFCLSIRSFTPRIPTLQAGCASTAPTLTTLWFRQTTVITCAAGLTDCIPPPERCFWMSAAALPRQTPPERPMP